MNNEIQKESRHGLDGYKRRSSDESTRVEEGNMIGWEADSKSWSLSRVAMSAFSGMTWIYLFAGELALSVQIRINFKYIYSKSIQVFFILFKFDSVDKN